VWLPQDEEVIPPTTIPSGAMVINHPIVHQGPAILALFALALVAGMVGGAMTGLLLYAKGKVAWQ
jgi:hypothetical protein